MDWDGETSPIVLAAVPDALATAFEVADALAFVPVGVGAGVFVANNEKYASYLYKQIK